MISLNSRLSRDRFDSRHFLRAPLAEDKHLIVLSGIVLVHFRGPDDPSGYEGFQLTWYREQLELLIDFDAALPRDRWFRIEQWVPAITLNAFDVQVPPDGGCFGGGWWHYPGVAVDSFRLDFNPSLPQTAVLLRGDIAVKHNATHLFRVAYHISLMGTLAEPPPPPG